MVVRTDTERASTTAARARARAPRLVGRPVADRPTSTSGTPSTAPTRRASAPTPPPSPSRSRSTTTSTSATTPSASSATSASTPAASSGRTASRSRSPAAASTPASPPSTTSPLPDSACVYCGNCIQVCPTGALMFKTRVRHARGGHVGRVAPDPHRHDLRLLRRRLQRSRCTSRTTRSSRSCRRPTTRSPTATSASRAASASSTSRTSPAEPRMSPLTDRTVCFRCAHGQSEADRTGGVQVPARGGPRRRVTASRICWSKERTWAAASSAARSPSPSTSASRIGGARRRRGACRRRRRGTCATAVALGVQHVERVGEEPVAGGVPDDLVALADRSRAAAGVAGGVGRRVDARAPSRPSRHRCRGCTPGAPRTARASPASRTASTARTRRCDDTSIPRRGMTVTNWSRARRCSASRIGVRPMPSWRCSASSRTTVTGRELEPDDHPPDLGDRPVRSAICSCVIR